MNFYNFFETLHFVIVNVSLKGKVRNGNQNL